MTRCVSRRQQVEPGRILFLERWESRAAVEAFRRAGVDEEQRAAILTAAVAQ